MSQTTAASLLHVKVQDNITVVQFRIRKILHEGTIYAIGLQFFDLASTAPGPVVLDFSGVEYMSSLAFGKLITMEKKMKQRSDPIPLFMCSIAPDIL